MGHKQSTIVGGNKLKLGFFSPNCSSGMAVTKVAGALAEHVGEQHPACSARR